MSLHTGGFALGAAMNVFRHSAVIGVIAIGMGIVCLTGDIDLSVGSMLAFVAGFSVVVFNQTNSIPLTLLFAVQHAVNALLSGLGEQRQALMPALAGSLLTLALLHRWTALPGARIAGAIRAMQLGQSATLLSTLWLLALALRQSKTPD